MAPCVRKVCFYVTDTLFICALIDSVSFDSRSVPLIKFILTCAVAASERARISRLLPQYVNYIEHVRLLHGKRQLQEYQTQTQSSIGGRSLILFVIFVCLFCFLLHIK